MSFGASNTTKTAMNNLEGTSNQALNNLFPAAMSAGSNAIGAGQGNVASGTNFFNTLLHGNQANTSALLQPDIDRIRQANQGTIQSISTLMPRGGGRSGTLFGASYAPQQQIGNLFNGMRSNAANGLAQIGLGQQGIGANLFGVGGQALNTATGANADLVTAAQRQQQTTNALYSALGSGLLKLATTPFGGGAAQNGLLGLL